MLVLYSQLIASSSYKKPGREALLPYIHDPTSQITTIPDSFIIYNNSFLDSLENDHIGLPCVKT